MEKKCHTKQQYKHNNKGVAYFCETESGMPVKLLKMFQPKKKKKKHASSECYSPSFSFLIQLTFTFSKSTVKTLEKGVKYVQS